MATLSALRFKLMKPRVKCPGFFECYGVSGSVGQADSFDLVWARKEKGFALVIALSLMSFILLLLLAITSLVRVEQSRSNQSLEEVRLAQATHLALMLALGDIQKHLGVDQRTSASAAILDEDVADDSAGEPVHPRWVGVWDTSGPGFSKPDHAESRERVKDSALTWLVSSGDSAGAIPDLSPHAALPEASRHEFMPDRQDPHDSAKQRPAVVAPLVDVEDAAGRILTRYSYFISDEGGKAKVSFHDAGRISADPVEKQSAPTKSGLEALTVPDGTFSGDPLLNSGGFDTPNTIQQLSKLLSVSDLGLTDGVTASQSEIRLFEDDLTTASFSILADSKRGGMKKDLSHALMATATSPPDMEPIFPAQGVAGYDPGGPVWRQLRDFVNKRSSSPSLGTITPDPYVYAQRNMPFSPVIARFQLFFYATFRSVGAPADGEYSVRYHIMPAVVLWNPYNVGLAGGDYYIALDSGAPYKVGVSVGQWSSDIWAETMRDEIDLNSFDSDNRGPNFKVSNPAGLSPGEVKVFSVASLTPFQGAGANTLEAGFYDGFGFYIDATSSFTVPSGESIDDYFIDIGASNANYSCFLLLLRDRAEHGLPNQEMQVVGVLSRGGVHNSFPWSQNSWNRSQDLAPWSFRPAAGGEPIFADDSDSFPAFGWVYSLALPSLRHWDYPDQGDDEKEQRRPLWSVFNPLAMRSGSNPDLNSSPYSYGDFNTIYRGNLKARPLHTNLNQDHYQISTGGQNGAIGFDDSTNFQGQVLVDLPESSADLSSIGELASAPLRYPFTRAMSGATNPAEQTLFAIGNSFAPPFISDVSKAETRPSPSGSDLTYYDFSYLLNEALWDSYFFSGIDYMSASDPRGIYQIMSDEFGYEETAGSLILDGGFNVNSTSILAWRQMLSQYFEESVQAMDGTVDFDGTGQTPLLRSREPAYSLHYRPGVHDERSAEASTGYRVLSQQEILLLAEAIVRQVKQRGPFLSLADFINRSVDPQAPAEHRLKGSLQAAIDEVSTNHAGTINDGFDTELDSHQLFPNPGAMDLPIAAGSPGYLLQSDILGRIGGQLTSRSDTFRIHLYVEILDRLSMEVLGNKSAVATVQRLPWWLESASIKPWETPSAGSLNERFGRRFVITQFMWTDETAN